MLVIFSGHLICRICRRHLLTQTCRSCSLSLVCFQVSEPYSRTDLTFVSNILSLVFLLMFLLLQIGLRVIKACLALPSLALMSSLAPPCFETMLPRYVKLFTSSMDLPLIVMAAVLCVFILSDLVLLVLISRPVDFAVTYKADVFCCMCWNWRDKIAFVKVRLFHFLPGAWGNHYLNKSLSIRSLSEVYVKYCDVVLAT